MSSAASQYTSGTLKPLMSMPMICWAACRASSSLRASLMPPALPRPPTGTCALTATGPSLRNASAASSGSRATAPGGMAMPSEARISLAWYSRSFTPPPSSRERARSGRAVLVVVPAFAEALPELRAVDQDDAADTEHDDDDEREPTADQDRRQRNAAAPRRRLSRDRAPGVPVPVEVTVVGDPAPLRVLVRHVRSSVFGPRAGYRSGRQSGMFPCHFGLRVRSLRMATRSARMSSPRVRPGSITASM